MPTWRWPSTAAELVELQEQLAAANRYATPFRLADGVGLVGGCFVCSAAPHGGPGRAGDRAWAAAVVWRIAAGGVRRSDALLRGAGPPGAPRRARDVVAQAVVAGHAAAPYVPGLLALRDGQVLGKALDALFVRPDVVLVDATGLDHPRRAGLAVQAGAVVDLPTVGVTRRPLLGRGDPSPRRRGERSPVMLDGEVVGYWVCTRSGVAPVVAHAAWRVAPAVAADIVLLASTGAARTPVPLQEARRVAREARALDAALEGDTEGDDQFRSAPASVRRSPATPASSSADAPARVMLSVVDRAAWATATMWETMAATPVEASAMLLEISPAVAVCSSTAMVIDCCSVAMRAMSPAAVGWPTWSAPSRPGWRRCAAGPRRSPGPGSARAARTRQGRRALGRARRAIRYPVRPSTTETWSARATATRRSSSEAPTPARG